MIPTYKELADLLLQAADTLQDNASRMGVSDPLAEEIYHTLQWKEIPNDSHPVHLGKGHGAAEGV